MQTAAKTGERSPGNAALVHDDDHHVPQGTIRPPDGSLINPQQEGPSYQPGPGFFQPKGHSFFASIVGDVVGLWSFFKATFLILTDGVVIKKKEELN